MQHQQFKVRFPYSDLLRRLVTMKWQKIGLLLYWFHKSAVEANILNWSKTCVFLSILLLNKIIYFSLRVTE